jgi:transposase
MKVLAEAECCNCGADVEIETAAKQVEDEFAWRAYQDDVGVCADCGMRHHVAVNEDEETAELLPDWDSLEEEEPCPCCGETDHCGIFTCDRCKKPACECCACSNMHFGCEAEASGGIYIGPRPEHNLV